MTSERMVGGDKHGQMVINTKEASSKVFRKGKGYIFGQMEQNMKVSSQRALDMD